MSFHISFREQIKTEMKRQNINRSELSRRIKTSRSYVSQFLKNRNFTTDSIKRFADALGCEVEIKLIPK